MKLSIEARVAAAVATAFVALTVGAIGQEHSTCQTGGQMVWPHEQSGVNKYLNQRGHSSSLVGPTNAEPDKGDYPYSPLHSGDLSVPNTKVWTRHTLATFDFLLFGRAPRIRPVSLHAPLDRHTPG